ncbi:unnamed protein product [Lactuca saligna]|uniref:Uncharacterized protein n=1 Tax=Lactuca saligna TaxID=75948 RepID=A0AA36E0Z1_LACSI|nr:unnamed protein product [Lactuca saligna]
MVTASRSFPSHLLPGKQQRGARRGLPMAVTEGIVHNHQTITVSLKVSTTVPQFPKEDSSKNPQSSIRDYRMLLPGLTGTMKASSCLERINNNKKRTKLNSCLNLKTTCTVVREWRINVSMVRYQSTLYLKTRVILTYLTLSGGSGKIYKDRTSLDGEEEIYGSYKVPVCCFGKHLQSPLKH